MLLSPRDAAPRDLHSFPTRRSSDLTARAGGATDLAQRLDRADLAARRLDRHERGVRADRGRHGFGIDPAQFVDRDPADAVPALLQVATGVDHGNMLDR